MSASAEITINPMMEAAELYALRGYTAMPVDPHTKRPSVPDWTTRRSMPADYWSGPGADLNICLVGGGGGILIVDLDGITYEEAAKYLPPTDAREGRKSSPSTHLVYDIIPEDWPEDALPKAGSAVRAAMDAGRIPRFPGVRHYKGTMERGGKRVGIDVLGAGGQANVAPSLHPSGERRQWHPDGRMRLPARVRWCDLIEAVERLVGQFGWRRPEPKSQAEADHDDLIVISDLGTGFPEDPAAEEFVEACRIELQRMAAAVSGKGGGLQTWKAAMTAADHGLDKDQALTVLTEWNTRCQPPWSGADLRTTLQRAYTGERINPIGYKQQETRKMEALASAGAEAMTLPAFATASGTSEAMIGSDIANGEAFAEDHADLVRYSPDGGGWYVFDGQRWALDTGDLKVQEMAKVTAKRLRIEAATEPNEDKRKRLMRYTERASSAAGIHAMLDMAHSIPAIALPVAAFDDPDRTRYLLNTPGGIIDLRTNDRKAHDPSLYITQDGGVRCERHRTTPHGGQGARSPLQP